MDSFIKLFIVSNLEGDVQKFENLLEKKGLACKCFLIDTYEEFEKKIVDCECDIALCNKSNSFANFTSIIKLIKSKNKNFPVVIYSDRAKDFEIVEAIKIGADEFVVDNDDRLLEVIFNLTNKTLEKTNLNIESKIVENEITWQDDRIFLNTVLENIPNMIYVKDVVSLKYTYINKAGESMTGYSKDELIGKNVHEIFNKDYADYYHKKDLELLQTGAPIEISEELTLTKENKLKIFFTKKILINDSFNNPKYLLGISEDLTDHLQAQEEIKKNELRFSKIFHSSPVAIFVAEDKENKIIDANTRFCDLFLMEKFDIVGRDIKDLKIFADEEEKQYIIENHKNHISFVNKEIEFVKKSGEKLTLLMSVENMKFGDEFWTIFMGLDISERKAAEIQIETALEKQKELNMLKTQFISMISHEFRTPLTTIMLSTDLLKRYGDRWNNEERAKHFERIQDTIFKMTQLMENVLIIGRIDSGKFTFAPEKSDFNAFCFKLAKNIEFSQSGAHKINLQMNGENAESKFDENLMGLVITNLLTNAAKYSPKGTTIDFTINHNKTTAEIIVRDRGIGIPEGDLKNLFSSFFRASNVGSIAGYGLGLSIVKKCVDAHRGKINVLSKVGEGTTFIVHIPTNLDREI